MKHSKYYGNRKFFSTMYQNKNAEKESKIIVLCSSFSFKRNKKSNFEKKKKKNRKFHVQQEISRHNRIVEYETVYFTKAIRRKSAKISDITLIEKAHKSLCISTPRFLARFIAIDLQICRNIAVLQRARYIKYIE
jgi:hypothetical protein